MRVLPNKSCREGGTCCVQLSLTAVCVAYFALDHKNVQWSQRSVVKTGVLDCVYICCYSESLEVCSDMWLESGWCWLMLLVPNTFNIFAAGVQGSALPPEKYKFTANSIELWGLFPNPLEHLHTLSRPVPVALSSIQADSLLCAQLICNLDLSKLVSQASCAI